jgi:hypothetical protein
VSLRPAAIAKEDGTASVELIGVVPFLLLAILIGAQLVLAGHALWSAGVAARAGARAALVGRDAASAAQGALPPSLRRGARVREGNPVSVEVLVPRLLPAIPPVSVAASSRLGPGG